MLLIFLVILVALLAFFLFRFLEHVVPARILFWVEQGFLFFTYFSLASYRLNSLDVFDFEEILTTALQFLQRVKYDYG
jgi:hypothetical protein